MHGEYEQDIQRASVTERFASQPDAPHAMRVMALVSCYESLTPESITDLLDFYADDAVFRDPFNAVQGRAAIGRIFSHMFTTCENVRFHVTHVYLQYAATEHSAARVCWMLAWDFSFESAALGGAQRVSGVSELRYGADGQIDQHIDSWDPSELYVRLPWVGWLFRKVRGYFTA